MHFPMDDAFIDALWQKFFLKTFWFIAAELLTLVERVL